MRSWQNSVCAILLLVLSGCGGSTRTQGANEELPEGAWSVAGIAVGNDPTVALQQLGPPTSTSGGEPPNGYHYRDLDINVNVVAHIVDGTRWISGVAGNTLFRDDELVLEIGQAEDQLLAELKTGYKVKRCKSRTSGMWTIPWGCVPQGTTYYYRDKQSLIAIYVNAAGVIVNFQSEWLRVNGGPLHLMRNAS